MFLAMPGAHADLGGEWRAAPPALSQSGRAGAGWQAFAADHPVQPSCRPETGGQATAKPVIEAEDLWFKYEKDQPDVVRGPVRHRPAGRVSRHSGRQWHRQNHKSEACWPACYRPYRGDL